MDDDREGTLSMISIASVPRTNPVQYLKWLELGSMTPFPAWFLFKGGGEEFGVDSVDVGIGFNDDDLTL